MDTSKRDWVKVPEAATLLGLPKTRTYELIQSSRSGNRIILSGANVSSRR